MKFQSFFAAALLSLTVGCFNQEPGDVQVTLDNKIQGEDGKNIQFAIFGIAENGEQTSAVIIASDNADLCGEIGNNAAAFINDIQAGEEPGEFILTTILVNGSFADGERFDGDQQENQLVDPQFIVGNGADLLVQAIDQDGEGTLNIDTFDGNNLVGSLEVNLNQEISGIFNDDLNDPMVVEIFASSECAALSDFAAAQL
jgi:hypothetical protein